MDYKFTIVIVLVLLMLAIYRLYMLLEVEQKHNNVNDFRYYPVDESTAKRTYITKRFDDNTNVLQTCLLTRPCPNPRERCIHIKEAFKLVRRNTASGGDSIDADTYPPNANTFEGYCMTIPVKSNAQAKRKTNKQELPLPLHPCNTNTGERIITRTVTGTYEVNCICKHPDIITQRIPLVSDCNVPVACSGGLLVGPHWWNQYIRVDIMNDLSCEQCPEDSVADRDPSTNKPICRKRTFVEKEVDDVYPSNFPLLPITHPAIAKEHAEHFIYSTKRHVPNPCAFDFFSRQPFTKNECELASTADQQIYFCKSNDLTVVTVQADDDYLRGNAGKWANGCFKFTEHSKYVDHAIAEYYNVPVDGKDRKNGPAHPIIGYAIGPSHLSSNAFNILPLSDIE